MYYKLCWNFVEYDSDIIVNYNLYYIFFKFFILKYIRVLDDSQVL